MRRLKKGVYRLALEDSPRASVVLKRLNPGVAQRNRLVVERWLPALGLGDRCPSLLGVAAERGGQSVWHVYEDLGNAGIDARDPIPDVVEAVVEIIAQLHTRAADAPILPECRHFLGDLGTSYFVTNVRDAVVGLEALGARAGALTSMQRDVRDRLLGRLRPLLESLPLRARLMREFGGPQTLLHGDLWTTNAFVLPNTRGVKARLIDWDQAGVGPLSYDLSTFLLRFPPRHRTWVLDLYREAVRSADWNLPPARDLNLLFETAEFARFANCIIWPAIALVHDRLGWGFDELAKVDQWFESWEPVLPEKYASQAVNSATS